MRGISDARGRLAALGGIALLLAIGLAIAWRERSVPDRTGSPLAPTTPPATPTAPLEAIQPIAPPFQNVPPYAGEAVGELRADPDFLRQVPAERYERSQQELTGLAAALARNPGQPPLWMRVAFLKHFYGNHRGAADAYEYLNVIAAGDAIPFYNLGVLYGYHLKEPARAVSKFEAAITRDPQSAAYYLGFGNFYREVAGDLDRAERTFLQGLARVPTDIALAQALGSLAVAQGDLGKAIRYYERALSNASLSSGERAAIVAEVGRLKSRLAR